MSSQPLGLTSQFTCISSLILLTHPEFISKVKSTFIIDRIFNKNREKLWTSGDSQNVSNIPMQTFIIILQMPVAYGKIIEFCKLYNDGASIFDIKPIEVGKEIPEEDVKPPTFPDDLSLLESGVEYNIEGSKGYKELIDKVPKTKGIRTGKIDFNGVKLVLFTNSYGYKVATLSS